MCLQGYWPSSKSLCHTKRQGNVTSVLIYLYLQLIGHGVYQQVLVAPICNILQNSNRIFKSRKLTSLCNIQPENLSYLQISSNRIFQQPLCNESSNLKQTPPLYVRFAKTDQLYASFYNSSNLSRISTHLATYCSHLMKNPLLASKSLFYKQPLMWHGIFI